MQEVVGSNPVGSIFVYLGVKISGENVDIMAFYLSRKITDCHKITTNNNQYNNHFRKHTLGRAMKLLAEIAGSFYFALR